MMAGPLTHNAIQSLLNGDVHLRPLLQVMDIRQIGNMQSTQERFRLVLSDGVFVQQAMLATQLNDYVKNKDVIKGTIVQLVEYICNIVQNRKIIIVLNFEIVQGVSDIIGNPQILASGSEQLPVEPAPAPAESTKNIRCVEDKAPAIETTGNRKELGKVLINVGSTLGSKAENIEAIPLHDPEKERKLHEWDEFVYESDGSSTGSLRAEAGEAMKPKPAAVSPIIAVLDRLQTLQNCQITINMNIGSSTGK